MLFLKKKIHVMYGVIFIGIISRFHCLTMKSFTMPWSVKNDEWRRRKAQKNLFRNKRLNVFNKNKRRRNFQCLQFSTSFVCWKLFLFFLILWCHYFYTLSRFQFGDDLCEVQSQNYNCTKNIKQFFFLLTYVYCYDFIVVLLFICGL